VATEISKNDLGSADALINFMEELAHPAETSGKQRRKG
jgi:hypothetical protein